jgi:hypothetical protein
VFNDSTIYRLTLPDLGWRYVATLHCTDASDNYTSTNYRDTLLATHGAIVMEIDFSSLSLPLALEEHLLAIMEFRAAAYDVGPVVGP